MGADSPRLVIVDALALTTPLDPYLSLKALADYSGLSVRTLRKLLIRVPPTQALPCYRLDGKVLVRRSEFDRYMAAVPHAGAPRARADAAPARPGPARS
jgi:hypothetical protein